MLVRLKSENGLKIGGVEFFCECCYSCVILYNFIQKVLWKKKISGVNII
jgi:hypothetical protein